MRLASVVQHSVKAPPLKHDVASLRVSTISALKRTGVPFPHSHFSSSFAVARGRRGQFYPVASARGAEQEDDLSTSGYYLLLYSFLLNRIRNGNICIKVVLVLIVDKLRE
uniref:Uncharacterized protein n=1 Tax=Rhizophora mucronata TaxID=61149 RepID=A0A2P2L5J8_RHIMU